jgi:hypothetical protein
MASVLLAVLGAGASAAVLFQRHTNALIAAYVCFQVFCRQHNKRTTTTALCMSHTAAHLQMHAQLIMAFLLQYKLLRPYVTCGAGLPLFALLLLLLTALLLLLLLLLLCQSHCALYCTCL